MMSGQGEPVQACNPLGPLSKGASLGSRNTENSNPMARKSVNTYRLPPNADLSNPEHVALLNQILQNVEQRLDTVQQVGVSAPPSVTGVSATGKQGSIWLTWQRIQNVDGYMIVGATDSAMSAKVMQFNAPHSDTCTYAIPIGNSATQYFFTVSAYRGNVVGLPSVTVSATSVVFSTSTEAAPLSPSKPRGVQL